MMTAAASGGDAAAEPCHNPAAVSPNKLEPELAART
jgi:hypothetical protein